jgi:hypothetical protein
MKKSELTNYIKENILSSLSENNEGESNEDKIKSTNDLTTAIQDLKKAKDEAGIEEANIGLADLEEMGYEEGEQYFESIKSRFKNRPDFKSFKMGFIQGMTDASGSYGLNEDEDEDNDKSAIKSANASRGKHKQLDIAVKALKDITTEMKSIARSYTNADGVEKEKMKDQLKSKTLKKKELESLVTKLEKDVV